MAKESRVSVDLAYVVGTQMQGDITRISHALKVREARLILKDMYESECITKEEYQKELKKLGRWALN